MNEFLSLALAMISGMLLGVVFFGGLWWTVNRGVVVKNAALWFLTSMLLRMSIVVLGFYFIMDNYWHRLITVLLGFILSRFLFLHFTRVAEQSAEPEKTIRHAP